MADMTDTDTPAAGRMATTGRLIATVAVAAIGVAAVAGAVVGIIAIFD